RERAVRGAALDRPLRALAGEQAVDQPRGEAVAAADSVEDLEVLAALRLVEPAVPVAHRAPVVEGCGLRVPERRRDDLEVRKALHGLLDHAAEVERVERRQV